MIPSPHAFILPLTLPYPPHLAQLHETVDDAQEAPTAQTGLRLAAGHVLLVQRALAAGQPARDHVLVLGRHLALDLRLEAAQQEGAQHAVQTLDQRLENNKE